MVCNSASLAITKQLKRFSLTSQTEEETTLLNNEDQMSRHSDEGADFKNDLVGIFDVIVHPQYNRAFIAVVTVMLGQQLCGQ